MAVTTTNAQPAITSVLTHHKKLHAWKTIPIQLLLEFCSHGLDMPCSGHGSCGHINVRVHFIFIIRDFNVQILCVLLPLHLTVRTSLLLGEWNYS